MGGSLRRGSRDRHFNRERLRLRDRPRLRLKPCDARSRSWFLKNSTRAIVEALAVLFAPDADTLRRPVDQVAALFRGQLFARTRPVAGTALTAAESVDLFLRGAVRSAA
jgi:hypothetical protein